MCDKFVADIILVRKIQIKCTFGNPRCLRNFGDGSLVDAFCRK